MKPNTGVGSANKPKSYPVKNSRPAPVRGKKKSVDIYHMTRGKAGKI